MPAFDVARIEPTGEAVIAGRATPGAKVELLRDGQVHDQTVADQAGEFVLIPKPLPRGAYDLSLRATQPSGEQVSSKDSIAVALGASARETPVVAHVAPDKPAEILSKPAGAPLKIGIDAVESEAAGKLFVSGHTTPGASVRLYLNDSFIAAATASPQGKVAFAIGSGVRPGDYRVRLDEVDAATGRVSSRAEVAFTAPAPGREQVAAAPSGQRTAAIGAAPPPTAPAPAVTAPAVTAPPRATVPPPAAPAPPAG
ncbi:MAG: hypothetical protein M5U07_15010 [Xanthobacteraceae bacterium]|nr:hypothetical protein [Xanthobacteraceae bacterium]